VKLCSSFFVAAAAVSPKWQMKLCFVLNQSHIAFISGIEILTQKHKWKFQHYEMSCDKSIALFYDWNNDVIWV